MTVTDNGSYIECVFTYQTSCQELFNKIINVLQYVMQ